MNNWRVALNELFNSYGLAAFPSGNVPEDTAFPYMTYEVSRADFGEETNTVVHLHYYSESEAKINSKADEICAGIRRNESVECAEGLIVLTTGSPEWYPVNDEDRLHKHRIINITTTWLLKR